MMITLTRYDGAVFYLNASQIKGVLPPDKPEARGRCRVITAGDSLEYSVLESPVEVIQLIKLASPADPVLAMLRDLMAIDGARDLLVELVGQLMADYRKSKPTA